MMDEQEFRTRCDATFEAARRALEPLADAHEFEVEYTNGNLTLEFEQPEPARFVVSPQTAVRQIWVSALSRSFRFAWSDTAQEFQMENGDALLTMLVKAAGEQLGTPLT